METSPLVDSAAPGVPLWLVPGGTAIVGRLKRQLEQVNKEPWLVLSVVAIAWLLNSMLSSERVLLGLYILPTVTSAYLHGWRHSTLTATASTLLVVYMRLTDPMLFGSLGPIGDWRQDWLAIPAWGGMLVVTAYLMGTLYKHKSDQLAELRQTYNGILLILRHFVSKDRHTENHSWRVSVYATRIASEMGLYDHRIEDVRAAALLHHIGKLDISREILSKAAQLTREEFEPVQGEQIPLETPIISAADA